VWSGGVHNFIRFLEDWGGATYRYRGSLAALFESEVAKGEYHEGYNYFYSPPTRNMGYHQYLSEGWFLRERAGQALGTAHDLRDIPKSEYDIGPLKPAAFELSCVTQARWTMDFRDFEIRVGSAFGALCGSHAFKMPSARVNRV